MSRNYAIFVSSNVGYLAYLNAFLNSLHKRECFARTPFTVFVIQDGSIPEEYIKATGALNYPITFVTMDDEEARLDPTWSSAWKCKAGRYHYIKEIGKAYDASCLMDADLTVVTDQFVDFFPLVDGTDKIIGCNERIKWQISDIYTLNGKPILPKQTRLDKFHCNVPLFLDVKEWEPIFDDYLDIVFRGRELREKEKVIGDIYSWNLAIYRNNRQDDVILMGMPGMTQVHRTGYRDKNSSIQVTRDGYWTTGDGDQVYCLHGRPDKSGFRNIERKNEFEKHNIDPGIYNRYVTLVEREWLDVNFNQAIDLRKYQKNPHWEEMAK